MLNKLVAGIVCLFLFSCKGEQEAQHPINHSSGNFIKQSVERNKQIFEEQETLFMDLFAKDSIPYKNSKNGFWYHIVQSNDSIPYQNFTKGDVISFDYKIRNTNNELIYPENEFIDQKYRVDKENIISGLRQGLILLKKDDIARFYFPSQKAFGFHGDENKIGTNVPIIVDVEIKDVQYQQNN